MIKNAVKDTNQTSTAPPIICIDGPAGVGKGTIALLVAEKLGLHILDSGSLYRIVGLSAHRENIDFDDITSLVEMTQKLTIEFLPKEGSLNISVNNVDFTSAIRTEECGNFASKIAVHQPIRDALVETQHIFHKQPGLVADGRDMGTIIFPNARCKLFLDASAEIRAERRYKQLKQKGISANLRALLLEIQERDSRDRNRPVAPLVPAEDAYVVDTSELTISDVLTTVATYISKRYPELAPRLLETPTY